MAKIKNIIDNMSKSLFLSFLIVFALFSANTYSKVYKVNLTTSGTLSEFTQSDEAKTADSLIVQGDVILDESDFLAIKKLIVSYNVIYVDIFETLNTSIGSQTFISCPTLIGFRFPKTLKSIGWYCFEYCSSLKDVYFPETLETIDIGTFRSCGLTKVVIPKNVKSLSDQAFYYCPLQHLYLRPTTPPMCTSAAFYPEVTSIDAILHVPEGRKSQYENADGWMYFRNIVETNANMFKLYVSGIKNGQVFINGDAIDRDRYVLIEEDSNVKIEFNPDYGYTLETVLLDGQDITNQVDNNVLILNKFNKESTISIKFDKIKALVSIKSANGTVKHRAPLNESQTYYINALDGWTVSYVGFNGVDVTNKIGENGKFITPKIYQDSELEVVYKSNESSIKEYRSSQIVVKTIQGALVIENATSNTHASIYKSNGELVRTLEIPQGTTTINLQSGEVYIIKVASETYKVVI